MSIYDKKVFEETKVGTSNQNQYIEEEQTTQRPNLIKYIVFSHQQLTTIVADLVKYSDCDWLYEYSSTLEYHCKPLVFIPGRTVVLQGVKLPIPTDRNVDTL